METAEQIRRGLQEASKEQAAGCIILAFVFLIPNS
jgi:hypothetical protein